MSSRVSAAVAALPTGTIPVGLGLLVNGVSTYGFQILAFRMLGAEPYAALNGLWVTAFILAPGLFLPLEQEIALLESQANPLEGSASEERVHRLATLKRQRRTLAQLDGRRQDLSARLDTLAVALQNIKLDVLRLSTGARSWQQVTTVAEQALALAKEIDTAVYVADELQRVNPRTSGSPRAASNRR